MICKHILLITFLNEPKLILLHTVKLFQVPLCITNNSIKHLSFVYSQLNDQTVWFQTIHFHRSHLFVLNLNAKQLYLTHCLNPFRCYHYWPKWTWDWWLWWSTPHSPKHHWSLSIRLFSVISRTLVGVGSYLSSEMQLEYFTPSANWADRTWRNCSILWTFLVKQDEDTKMDTHVAGSSNSNLLLTSMSTNYWKLRRGCN